MMRADLTIDIIQYNPVFPWDWELLSSKFNIYDILCNPQLQWCSTSVSYRDDINIRIVNQFAHFKWNWRILSNIMSLDDIEANPCLPWKKNIVYHKQNLRYEERQFGLIIKIVIALCMVIFIVMMCV